MRNARRIFVIPPLFMALWAHGPAFDRLERTLHWLMEGLNIPRVPGVAIYLAFYAAPGLRTWACQ